MVVTWGVTLIPDCARTCLVMSFARSMGLAASRATSASLRTIPAVIPPLRDFPSCFPTAAWTDALVAEARFFALRAFG